VRSGISYWSMPGGLEGACPLETALELTKANHFDVLELCLGSEGVVHPRLTEQECTAARRKIDNARVSVETLASGLSWGDNPVSNSPEIREKSIEMHERGLQCAAWLGCEAMLMVPGVVTSPISPGERVRYDHAIRRARENVSRLLRTAERVGVHLCLENVWNGLFYSPLEFIDFVDQFGSERLGIYFDVGNLLGYQQHPPHWVELLGERIKRVHVKGFRENFGFSGTYEFSELAESDVPLLDTIRALQAVGYDSTVVAEMLPFHEGLLESTSATLNRALIGTCSGFAAAK